MPATTLPPGAPDSLCASMPMAGVTGVEHVAVAGQPAADELERLIAGVRPDAVVVLLDLSAVPVVDLGSLSAIRAAAARLRAQHRRLVVLPGGRPLRGRAARHRHQTRARRAIRAQALST